MDKNNPSAFLPLRKGEENRRAKDTIMTTVGVLTKCTSTVGG